MRDVLRGKVAFWIFPRNCLKTARMPAFHCHWCLVAGGSVTQKPTRFDIS
jgi:hypothetical protein